MTLPQKKPDENRNQFLTRCIENSTMNKEYSDQDQRYAVCMSQTKSSILEQVCGIIEENSLGLFYP